MELGDVRLAERWLDAGMPPDYQGSRIGSGLMIAAWEGKIELMRLFVSRGADINKLNSNGESALALAAWRGQMEAVKWLLERGARINASDRHWSALHYAVFAGNAELAEYLMERGADINARSSNGSSVLMMAVYEGHPELARKLIEKGADRTPKNDWGDGALEWAMRQDRLDIARMVSNPEEFNIAIAKPKESWGGAVRSLRTSKELENLLNIREALVKQGASTEAVDKRISIERMRIVHAEMGRGAPERAATMEITASRAKPLEQSAQIIYDDSGKAVGYKAPPATYFGTPKMPPKTAVKNY
ncbi:MAG: ankyrin repeat domain-containing protein [Betaproteobacteria bacterium]|nr:ankyrin repeat domain-containing protein [Betaproteobacteria bacterium]